MAYVKHWWTTGYAEDIFAYFLWKEKNAINYRGRSPQLSERGRLVELICLLGERLTLCNTAVHLAIRLLDLFMDNHRVEPPHLELVALGCLLLASKFEERECNVPHVQEFHQVTPRRYPQRDYLAIEAILLEFFDWNVSLVTVAHFVEFFATRALRRDDLVQRDTPLRSFAALRSALFDHLSYFMDLSLRDIFYTLMYPPSLVASACLLAARTLVGISPAWPADLARLTGYTDARLLSCAHALLREMYAERASCLSDDDSPISEDRGLEHF